MKNLFSFLPVDVFLIVQSYLALEGKDVDHDYRSLMNANRKLFSQVKYETTRFLFRNSIFSNIFGDFFPKLKSSYYQMSLYITFHEGLNYFSLYDIILYKIPLYLLKLENHCVPHIRFNELPRIYHLHIQYCYDLVKLEPLPRITKLTLESCSVLTDISCLNDRSNVLESVTLINCRKLKNIDSLFGIKTVLIKNCLLINDVSTLGNHEVFSFDNTTTQLTCSSFQNFKNVKTLSIKCQTFLDCNFDALQEMKGELRLHQICSQNFYLRPCAMSSFQGYSLSFSNTEISDPRFLWNCHNLVSLSLSNVCGVDYITFQNEVLPSLPLLKELFLHDLYGIVDLNGMEKISELTLSELPELTSLTGIGNSHRYIELRDIGEVTDFTPLNGTRKVLLYGNFVFTDFRDFTNIRYLEFHSCCNLFNSGESLYIRLENIHVLRLFYCNYLKTLYGLSYVKHLIVGNCVQLEDISDLGNNDSVMISGCPKITRSYKEGVYESFTPKIPKFVVI
jgi:hypothetical protein